VVALALRFGLPPLYETPAAIVLGVVISLGYVLAGQMPGGTVVADALFRGVAVGLTSAGAIATIRRLVAGERKREPRM
jgi:hypothetical protein